MYKKCKHCWTPFIKIKYSKMGYKQMLGLLIDMFPGSEHWIMHYSLYCWWDSIVEKHLLGRIVKVNSPNYTLIIVCFFVNLCGPLIFEIIQTILFIETSTTQKEGLTWRYNDYVSQCAMIITSCNHLSKYTII